MMTTKANSGGLHGYGGWGAYRRLVIERKRKQHPRGEINTAEAERTGRASIPTATETTGRND